MKRGLAPIVVVVIIVLLSIGALSAVWVYVRPLAGQASQISDPCFSFVVSPVKCDVSGKEVTVNVQRKVGNVSLVDLRFIFGTSSGQDSASVADSKSGVLPDELETTSFLFRNLLFTGISKVSVAGIVYDPLRKANVVCEPTAVPIDCVSVGRGGDKGGVGDINPGGGHESQPAGPCNFNFINAYWSNSTVSGASTTYLTVDTNQSCGSTQYVTFTILNNIGLPVLVRNASFKGLPMARIAWAPEYIPGGGNSYSFVVEHNMSQIQSASSLNVVPVSGPGCSNGIDDNGNGLVDADDPSCWTIGSNPLSYDPSRSEVILPANNNFKFLFASDGYLEELNWTNGRSKRIVWDEHQSNPQGVAPSRYLLHSPSEYPYGWKYVSEGQTNYDYYDTINYTKLSQGVDTVKLSAEASKLLVNDTVKFYGDTMYVTVVMTSKALQKMTVTLPVNLGSLQLDAQSSKLLQSTFGGYIDSFTYEPYPSKYPIDIVTYSPVSAIWDNSVSIGQQYITDLHLPSYVSVTENPRAQYTPLLKSFITTDLEAGESKRFVIAFKIASGNDWASALSLYKSTFERINGGAPKYCPTGSYAYLVGSNVGPSVFNNVGPGYNASYPYFRYYPNITFAQVFLSSGTFDRFNYYELDAYGIWQTAIYSGYVSLNGPNEFNPDIDLIDPGFDIARNPDLLINYSQPFKDINKTLFWFARPCADIDGANITYYPNGSYSFVRGLNSDHNGLYLNDIQNRNKQYNRLDYLASRGVRGFYFDATGCPGDEEFFDYSKTKLEQKYGDKFFFVIEGARDRVALKYPQIPILKLPTFPPINSQLIQYLVPQGTYYGGISNSPLNVSEFDTVLGYGYQAIPFNSLTFTPDQNQWPFYRFLCDAYANRLSRWNSYGSSINGCSIPQPPKYCCDGTYSPRPSYC